MSKYEYNEDYVRSLLDKLPGKKEDILEAFAEVHEVHVDVPSNAGLYRSPDLVSILTEAVNNDRLARIDDNLECRISKASIAYEAFKNLGKKAYGAFSDILKKATIPIRYPIYGLLPGDIQVSLERRHHEDSYHYTISSCVLEALSGAVLFGYGVVSEPSLALVACSVGGMGMVAIAAFRGVMAKTKSLGSPFTTIPYYAFKLPYSGAMAIKDYINEEFSKAKNKLESGAAGLSQLPSTEKSIKLTESSGPK